MAISEIVDVSLEESAEGTTLESFDTPGIMAAASDTTPTSYTAGDGVRGKEYDLTAAGLEAIAGDWGPSSKAHAKAEAMVRQEPRPAKVVIMRRNPAVAIVKKITFTGSFGAGHSAIITVNGIATASIPFNSDHETTLEDIADAIAALEGIDTAVDDGTDDITVTAESEWPLSIAVALAGAGAPTAAVTTTTAGRTIADDIAAALAEDDTNTWYGLVLADDDKGAQLAASDRIEATEKELILVTNEPASKTAGGSTALAIRVSGKNLRRTIGIWHHDPTQCIDAAALATQLGYAPGAAMMAHREYAGVTPTPTSALDAAGVTVLEGRNFNTYRKFGAFGMLRKGRRADGKVADATRDLDYARNEYRVAFLLYLSQTTKPPFDEGGLAAIQAIGNEVTRRLVSEGIFRSDKPALFIVPKLSDLSPSDIDAQLVAGCKVQATLLKGVLEVEINLQAVI